MPETIAENRNTIGISGVDHQGFALTDPKMKPDVAVQQERRGDPDQRDHEARAIVDPQRLRAHVVEPSVSRR